MLEEASTGTSGATGRQITLDARSLAEDAQAATLALLTELEAADRRGVVQLAGEAIRLHPARRLGPSAVTYLAERDVYLVGVDELPRQALLEAASTGAQSLTLTGRLPRHFGEGVHRQPLLAVATQGPGPTGDPALPLLPDANPMLLRGIDIAAGATLLVDGTLAAGEIRCLDADFAPKFCASQYVEVRLDAPPTDPGLHLLQVQNPDGPLSNELPICVGPAPYCL
jgi:hypothetical protein